MNLLPPSSRRRASAGAFTLIELLTVMAIILILAGLVIAIAGNANYKSALARAETEIKAMETAMESYKADNGIYPRSPDTDALLPVSEVDPYIANKTKYIKASAYLFQQLSGRTDLAATGATPTPGKSYMTFTPGQLSTGSANAAGGASASPTHIIDPFGAPYGYSTAAVADAESTSPAGNRGYNPTFDLWSTAGYGGSGKNYGTLPQKQSVWQKNW